MSVITCTCVFASALVSIFALIAVSVGVFLSAFVFAFAFVVVYGSVRSGLVVDVVDGVVVVDVG